MKLSTQHKAPQIIELMNTIRREAPEYSSKLFGLGANKSILIRKSAFIAVQVSRRDNELTIEGSLPSPILSVISSLLFIEGLGYLFEIIFHKQWKRLEIEISKTISSKHSAKKCKLITVL